MINTASHLKRLAPLAAGLLLPVLASSETVLFEDDFDFAVVNEQPTIPPWSSASDNQPASGNTILVDQDWSNVFGKGTENKIMEFHGTDSAMVIAADLPDTDAEVVTLSFDFVEPDGGKTDPLILFMYAPDGSTRAERLRLTHGGTGASAPLPENRVYALDTLNRLDWILNNSNETLTYLSGVRSLEAGKSDVWINGTLILSGYSFEGFSPGPIRGLDIRTFGNTPNQHILFDDIQLVAGARVRLSEAATNPLVEFLFNGNLLNTGSLGGEGTFIHPREASEGWVFESRPSIGVGLSREPGTGLDNSQVGGMGNYSQATIRDGVMLYNPGQGLHDLQSVTITGWFNAEEPWQNNAHVVSKPNALHAYAGSARIAFEPFLDVSTNRRETSGPTPWQQEANRWIFFALTFDGTTDVSNVVFYRGYEEEGSFQRDVVRSRGPIGAIRNVGAELAIGNSFFGTGPFKGRLDNIRIFGSTEDGSGALPFAAIASIWAQDRAAASTPTMPEVRIVDISHDGNSFSVAFETDPGFTYVVESSTDLADWSDVQYTVEGDGAIKAHTDWVTGVDRRFYRVRIDNN